MKTSREDDDYEDDDLSYVIPQFVRKDSLRSNHTAETEAETVFSNGNDNDDHDAHDEDYDDDRLVKFAETQELYFIESFKDYTKQERELSWYSQKENKKRNSKLKSIAKRMEAGKPEKKSCPYRGLACWTCLGAAAMEDLLDRMYTCIADEQEVQWLQGISNPKRLARKSQKLSAASVTKAFKTAYQDEQAAVAIYQAPEPTKKSRSKDDASSVGSSSVASSVASSKKKSKDNKKKKKRLGRKKSDAPLKNINLKEFLAKGGDDSSVGSLSSAASSIGSSPSLASSVGSLVSASAANHTLGSCLKKKKKVKKKKHDENDKKTTKKTPSSRKKTSSPDTEDKKATEQRPEAKKKKKTKVKQ